MLATSIVAIGAVWRAFRTFGLDLEETFSYYAFPSEHQRSIRTNNPLERIMREIRRRTRVVGAFPDGNSAILPICARLKHIAGKNWGTKRYLDMSRLAHLSDQQTETQSA